MKNRKSIILLTLGLLLIIIAGLFYVIKLQDDKGPAPVTEVKDIPQVPVKELKEQYDVVVVGTDPEGVAAAVSAARNGLKTLLVDGKNREILGGLFTLGWLNSLDMNRAPDGVDYYNKGIFKEWFDRVEGDSFAIITATNAFHELVEAEDNIEVRLGMKSIEPIISTDGGATTVTGAKLTAADGTVLDITAGAVIDATQDGDFAAAAGAPFTFGREDIGDDKLLMAVTPVYELVNVTPEVWDAISKRQNNDDDPDTGANNESVWGFKEMWEYPSTNPERIRSRGLNIGRSVNDTAFINAVQIFEVDPFNPASIEEAYEIARKEIPLMLDYLKSLYPELEPIELGALAPELYVRETRHLIGEYRLTMTDLLEQQTHPDDIAFGSYPVDIQSTSSAPTDRGAVVMRPKFYGVPFRTLVPQEIDGLLVVGRSASFDSLPHGSARVVPLGMATAQAAGAAAKLAQEEGITFRELSASESLIATLKERLTEQGMDLTPPKLEPYPFISHPAYEGMKLAVSMGISQAGYGVDFGLDIESNPKRLFFNLTGASKTHPEAFAHSAEPSIKDIPTDQVSTMPLTLEQAAYSLLIAVEGEAVPAKALDVLMAGGLVQADTLALIKDRNKLTNGDVYMLIKDVVDALSTK
ncbi:FAD-dependent oxidoreductase [Paenibacillus sp. PAMC21692]|uniref:FAD-dependent oxidoreductase n=1 Tax=Paenibacillus sp. PAMC21692 TaxID=2762320 RepID=UPI00164D928A|nr:FAD-dependent oxidoreductase [Paenibacillus sp. PAMC21692]QNK59643.1 FAD-dependent oxidoreductase [Paenibacillus sp. PAMC21692]